MHDFRSEPGGGCVVAQHCQARHDLAADTETAGWFRQLAKSTAAAALRIAYTMHTRISSHKTDTTDPYHAAMLHVT